MSGRDYRELQLSSTQLVIIFISLLTLGVVIFLLGVSVGKKQAILTNEQAISSVSLEPVEQEQPVPVKEQAKEPAESIKEELASHQQVQTKKAPSQPQDSSLSPKPETGYYIQVGAFNNRDSARALADKYKEKGFSAVVFDPLPTDRKALFRVRIGSFPTREEAESALEKLVQNEGKKNTDYFIVRS
ncbi:MAG: SPOR domain-containing protein [Acidobacteriota bacterium]